MASTQKQLIFRLYWDFISSGLQDSTKASVRVFFFFLHGEIYQILPSLESVSGHTLGCLNKIYPTFAGMQGNKGRQSRNWADWLQWRQLTSESKAQEPLTTQAEAWQALSGRISQSLGGSQIQGNLLCVVWTRWIVLFSGKRRWQEQGSAVWHGTSRLLHTDKSPGDLVKMQIPVQQDWSGPEALAFLKYFQASRWVSDSEVTRWIARMS